MASSLTQSLLGQGYSLDEVRAHARSEYEQLVEQGYTPEETNDVMSSTYGFRFDDWEADKQLTRDVVSASMQPQGAAMKEYLDADSKLDDAYYTSAYQWLDAEAGVKGVEGIEKPEPKEDSFTTMDALKEGWRSSTGSLAFFPPTKKSASANPDDISLWDKFAMEAAQEIGDIPTSVPGAVMGFAAGSATLNPLIAAAGAWGMSAAVSETMRQSLMDSYERGAVTTWEEGLSRTARYANTFGTEMLLNAPIGYGVGKSLQSAAFVAPNIAGKMTQAMVQAATPLGVEIAGGAAASAAREKRMPTFEDIILGAAQTFGTRATSMYTDKVSYAFTKKALTPFQVAWRMAKDPAANEDMRSKNLVQPLEDGGNFTTIFTIRPRRLADDHSWLTQDKDLERTTQRVKDLDELDKTEREFVSAMNSERKLSVDMTSHFRDENGEPNQLYWKEYEKLFGKEPLDTESGDEFSANLDILDKHITSYPFDRDQAKKELDAHFTKSLMNMDTEGVNDPKARELSDKLHTDRQEESNALTFGGRRIRHYEKELWEERKRLEDLQRKNKYIKPDEWWFYSSEAAAQARADLTNEKRAGDKHVKYKEEDEFVVVPYQVPATQKLVSIYGSEDPLVSEMYGFFQAEAEGVNAADVVVDRRKAWTAMNKGQLLEVLRRIPGERYTTKTLGQDPTKPLGDGFPGVKWYIGESGVGPHEKIRIWDRSVISEHTDARNNQNLSLDTSSEMINASLSIGETSRKKVPFAKRAKQFYSNFMDAYHFLNEGTSRKEWTDGYKAARAFNGVDGLVKHWLYFGRTDFLHSGDFVRGEKTTVNGESLLQAIYPARNDVGTIDTKTRVEVGALGRLLGDMDIEGLGALMGEADVALKNGDMTKDQHKQLSGQVLEARQQLSDPTDPMSVFRVLLVARQGLALERRGVKTGIPREAMEAVANNTYLQKRYAEASKKLREYQTSLLQYKVDSGLMTKQSMAKILKNNPDYIPFDRVDDGSDIPHSERKIIDPIESIIRQTQQTITEAERNSVLRTIAEEQGTRLPDLDAHDEGQSIEESAAARTLESSIPQKEILRFRVNGKERRYRVDPEVFKATEGLSPKSLSDANALVRAAVKGTNMFRLGTVLSLTFSVTNSIRDQGSAFVQSEHGFIPVLDTLKGAGALLNKKGEKIFPDAGSDYAKWLRARGANASLMSMDRKWTQENWSSFMEYVKPHNVVPLTTRALNSIAHNLNPLNATKNVIGGLSKLSEGSEDSVRMGEFLRAQEQGKTEYESGMASREITIDFARMGSSMQAMGALSAFLNASIQGVDRATRAIIKNPTMSLHRVVSGIVLPSLLLEMVTQSVIQEDPESDRAKALRESPDWLKEGYWRVPAGDVIFTIPKPHEYIPLTAAVSSFVEFMYEEHPDNTFLEKMWDDGLLELTAKNTMLDPMTILSSGVFTILGAPLSVAMNYSLFTQQPLIPADQLNIMAPYRYNRNTTELSKALSKSLWELGASGFGNMGQNFVSPQAIDHMVNGVFGTLGKSVWEGLSYLYRIGEWKGAKVEDMSKEWHELPGVRAFFIQFPHSGSSSISEFYDKAKSAGMLEDTVRSLMKTGHAGDAQEARRLLGTGAIVRVDKLRKAISMLSDQIVNVDRHETMSGEDKRDKITELQMMRIKLARVGIEYIDKAESEFKKSKKKK